MGHRKAAGVAIVVLVWAVAVAYYQWTEPEPPEPGKPVLQIHGTKPPSIDLSLRIHYVATTKKRKCQNFTALTMGYVPKKPIWHVWPHEPPSHKPNRRDRVVPMDTTGPLRDSLQEQDLEAFRWTVNAGWGGKPIGCDFELKYVTLEFRYDKNKNERKYKLNNGSKIGQFYINFNTNKCDDVDGKIYKYLTKKYEYVECKWGGFSQGVYSNSELECGVEKNQTLGYCLRNKESSVNFNMRVRYKNSS